MPGRVAGTSGQWSLTSPPGPRRPYCWHPAARSRLHPWRLAVVYDRRAASQAHDRRAERLEELALLWYVEPKVPRRTSRSVGPRTRTPAQEQEARICPAACQTAGFSSCRQKAIWAGCGPMRDGAHKGACRVKGGDSRRWLRRADVNTSFCQYSHFLHCALGVIPNPAPLGLLQTGQSSPAAPEHPRVPGVPQLVSFVVLSLAVGAKFSWLSMDEIWESGLLATQATGPAPSPKPNPLRRRRAVWSHLVSFSFEESQIVAVAGSGSTVAIGLVSFENLGFGRAEETDGG